MSNLTPDSISDKSKKLIGTVDWFNEKMGYGFIKMDAGQDIFVHYSAVQTMDSEFYKAVNKGDRVRFELVEGKRGPQASLVEVLSEAEPSVFPYEIYDNLRIKSISPHQAIQSLEFVIENSTFDNIRVNAIKFLIKIKDNPNIVFKILENLLTSDLSEEIRSIAAQEIVNNFLIRSEELIIHVIKNEKKIDVIISLYNALKKVDSAQAEYLINKMTEIIGIKNTKAYAIDLKESMGLTFLEKITGVDAVEGGFMDYDVLSFNVNDKHITSLDIHDVRCQVQFCVVDGKKGPQASLVGVLSEAGLHLEHISAGLKIGELDAIPTFHNLKSIIENSEIDAERIRALKYMNKLSLKNRIYYKFLENLAISDINKAIREFSIRIIIDNFCREGENGNSKSFLF